MHPEHGFLLLFLAIAVFLFVRAHNYGVVSMLWSFAGICAGLAGGWIFYGMIPDLFPDWEAGFRTRLFLSALVALIPYLIVRFVAKAVLTRAFEADSPLGGFADGIGGGILSLIPTAVTIVIIIVLVRVGGTWADLRRFEKLSIPGVDYLEEIYPKRPTLAEWRDGLERLPMVESVFGTFDGINRIPERNMVGLLITTKKDELFDFLIADPETGPLMVSEAFAGLRGDGEIAEMNEKREHFKMLQDERVRMVAADPDLREGLERLELHRVVDEFLLSPERQTLLESLKR